MKENLFQIFFVFFPSVISFSRYRYRHVLLLYDWHRILNSVAGHAKSPRGSRGFLYEIFNDFNKMAEREGFEPSIQVYARILA